MEALGKAAPEDDGAGGDGGRAGRGKKHEGDRKDAAAAAAAAADAAAKSESSRPRGFIRSARGNLYRLFFAMCDDEKMIEACLVFVPVATFWCGPIAVCLRNICCSC